MHGSGGAGGSGSGGAEAAEQTQGGSGSVAGGTLSAKTLIVTAAEGLCAKLQKLRKNASTTSLRDLLRAYIDTFEELYGQL